jgi:hypothetical protein
MRVSARPGLGVTKKQLVSPSALDTLPLATALPHVALPFVETTEGGRFLRRDGDRCVFLTDERRCGLHAAFGSTIESKLRDLHTRFSRAPSTLEHGTGRSRGGRTGHVAAMVKLVG